MRQGFEKLGLSHQPTTQSQRMNIHTNARLTPRSRETLVETIIQKRRSAKAAAAAFAVSECTARKWVARFRTQGAAGLRDRSSRPLCSPRQIPPAQVAVVLALRRLRMPAFQIARQCALSKATVSRLLRRHRLHRLALLDPPPPARRYERQQPGELIHLESRNSLGLSDPVTALRVIAAIWSEAQVGNTSMSPLMMLPASPLLVFFPMNPNTAPSLSSTVRSLTSAPWGSSPKLS